MATSLSLISSWFLLFDSVPFFLSYSSLKKVRFFCCFFFVSFFFFFLFLSFLKTEDDLAEVPVETLLVFHILLLADKILVFHLFDISLFIYYFLSLFSYINWLSKNFLAIAFFDFFCLNYSFVLQNGWKHRIGAGGKDFLAKLNVYLNPYFRGFLAHFRNECATARHYCL